MHQPPARDVAPLIEAQGLVRAFGGRRVLGGIDLAITPGECLALFGPNGAGKTTLLRLLAGLLRPGDGRAAIAGHEARTPDARALVGVISHQTMLYPALTAHENVRFAARLHGVAGADAAALRALERMGIADRAATPVRALSRGMQQRVTAARALVHGPRVLLLDEPFTGLDDAGVTSLATIVSELARDGAAILLVTHDAREGLALATHVAVLHRGAIVLHEPRIACGEPDAFTARYRALLAS